MPDLNVNQPHTLTQIYCRITVAYQSLKPADALKVNSIANDIVKLCCNDDEVYDRLPSTYIEYNNEELAEAISDYLTVLDATLLVTLRLDFCGATLNGDPEFHAWIQYALNRLPEIS